jgi:Cytochrome c oxidase biogenesis protein Cmc1 like
MIKLDYMQVKYNYGPSRIAHFLKNCLEIQFHLLFLFFSDCCRGRILSMAWACRAEAKEFSNCMSKYTGKIGTMKAMWIARGSKHKMTEAEWDILLNDVIASD